MRVATVTVPVDIAIGREASGNPIYETRYLAADLCQSARSGVFYVRIADSREASYMAGRLWRIRMLAYEVKRVFPAVTLPHDSTD